MVLLEAHLYVFLRVREAPGGSFVRVLRVREAPGGSFVRVLHVREAPEGPASNQPKPTYAAGWVPFLRT